MTLFIVALTLLLSSNSSNAIDEKPISPEINQLSANICAKYGGDATQVAIRIKATIIRHMKKHENNLKPTPEQIIKFLNKYKNQLLCGNTNYMVESFRHGAFNQLFNIFFYEELLVEDEDLYVDINAISYTGGVTETEPETVLDYMDRRVKAEIVPTKQKKEIQYLIDFFVSDLGGKRFAELTEEEQAAAQRRKPN
jgi:hypothetical protein